MWLSFPTGWDGLEATVDIKDCASGTSLACLWQYLLKNSYKQVCVVSGPAIAAVLAGEGYLPAGGGW